jgi:hypothetical protein
MYSTKFVTVSHFPGFPLYSILGVGIGWLTNSINSQAYFLALCLSTIPAIITCILVFFAVRKQTDNLYAPYVAALALAGSHIFIAQSIIPEIYIFSAFIVTACYTALIYKRYILSAVLAGFCFAVHPFVIPAVIALFIWSRELRRYWYLIAVCAILPYGYMVYAVIKGNEWNASLTENSVFGILQYVAGTVLDNYQYWGGIAIWKFPERIFDLVILVSVSFGIATLPMILYFKEWKKSAILIAAAVIPLVYFLTCQVPTVVAHLTLALPFLAIAAGLGVEKLQISPRWVLACGFILLICLPLNFDIGNTVDTNLSATNMYNQISEIPDGSIVISWCEDANGMKTVGGREQVGIMYYDKVSGKNIVPLNIMTYMQPNGNSDRLSNIYRRNLRDRFGIQTPVVIADLRNCSAEERSDLIHRNINLIVQANSDRKVYITTLPNVGYTGFCRVLKEVS